MNVNELCGQKTEFFFFILNMVVHEVITVIEGLNYVY